MTPLHIINQSPFKDTALASCLRYAAPGNALLLIESAVIAGLAGGTFSDQIVAASQKHSLYILGPDLIARGLQDQILECLQCVDYEGFVTLTVQHNPIHHWN